MSCSEKVAVEALLYNMRHLNHEMEDAFLTIRILCTAFLVLIFTGMIAAASEHDDLRSLSIEELMEMEVVSSTQQSVRLPEAPSTVHVVTGDQIRRWGIRRLSELVDRLIPGAMAIEDSDDQILAFRGVAADNNLKVLLLLNGHDYNSQWNNGPTSEVELGLMEDIKRVEVLIGPHSAVYGSGALIGVINIITRTGLDFSGVRVSGNYGSGDYKRGELIAGGQSGTDLNYFVSMGGLASEGYKNNDNEPLNISRFPLSWKFYGNINYKDFELMTRYTRSSRAFYIQKASTTSPSQWTNYDTFFVDGRRTLHLKEHLIGVFNFNYDAIQTQRHDFNSGIKMRGVGESRFSMKFTSFYSGWSGNDIVLGAYYRRDEFGDDWAGDNFNLDSIKYVDGTVIGIPSDPYTKRTLTPYGRNVYAFFGQDSVRLSERYSLLLGFRFDRIEAPQIPHPDTFTPRIAFLFKPNSQTVLKAMFTSGLSRQPNAAVVSPDSFAFGAPLITAISEPERMYSGELSASYRLRNNADLSLNFFYNSLQNMFGVERNLPEGAVTRLLAAGRIDYVGFEAVAGWNITEDLFVRFSHQNVQFGSVTNDVLRILTTPDGMHPRNYPENATKLLADLRIGKGLTLSGNANLVWNQFGTPDPKAFDTTLHTGFYAIVNATAVWNFTSKTQIILSASNILNKQLRIPPFDLFAYLPERNFNLTVGYWF